MVVHACTALGIDCESTAGRRARTLLVMYIVAGATGKTGAIVADALLGAGEKVRVLVRDAARGEKWRARGAEVAIGSLDQERELARALDGAKGAYLLSPQDPRSADPISAGWRIAHAVANAVAQSGLGHLVFLSSLGAEHAEGTGITRTLHAAEERLAEVPGKVTFVRASYHLENWAAALGAASGGKLPTFIHPDRRIPMVSVRDVGAVAARALLEGAGRGGRDVVEVAGPQDYSPREIASALGNLLGKSVVPEHVPLQALPQVFASFGASTAFGEEVMQLHQFIEHGKLRLGAVGTRLIRGSVDAQSALRALLA
jgi:uncharacterized protein YbjT (DUF2867 family)